MMTRVQTRVGKSPPRIRRQYSDENIDDSGDCADDVRAQAHCLQADRPTNCKVTAAVADYKQRNERSTNNRRALANSNERRRMENINKGFKRLQGLLAVDDDKISKARILEKTYERLKYLEQLHVTRLPAEPEVVRTPPCDSRSPGQQATYAQCVACSPPAAFPFSPVASVAVPPAATSGWPIASAQQAFLQAFVPMPTAVDSYYHHRYMVAQLEEQVRRLRNKSARPSDPERERELDREQRQKNFAVLLHVAEAEMEHSATGSRLSAESVQSNEAADINDVMTVS